jgi:hypothetical protein
MNYILICPACGEENPLTSDECTKCHTSLEGVLPTSLPEEPDSEGESLGEISDVENDLPGLFQALKNDETDIPDEESTGQEPEDLSDLFEDGTEEDVQEEEKVPEWLKRIRQRANEEPDAKGDITQKISTAIENITEDKSENRNEDFRSWIENIRKKETPEEIEKPAPEGDVEEEVEEPSREDEDWLTKIRKAEGKLPLESDEEIIEEEPVSPEEKKGDSLLQWLVALEDGEEEPVEIEEEDVEVLETPSEVEPTSETGEMDLETEITQEISLADSEAYSFRKPVLEIERDEQLQADQLAAIIIDEQAPRPALKASKKSSKWVVRIIISLLIILSVVFSIYFGTGLDLSADRLPQNEAVLVWAVALSEGAPILLVFDYSPGFASEMKLVVEPVIRIILAKDSQISVISSSISGGILAQSLFEQISPGEAKQIKDLGYVPLGSFGGYGIASQTQDGGSTPYLPELNRFELSTDYAGIVILSDQAEGAKAWVEQFSALSPTTPTFLLLSSQAGPMSVPYWESGQVSGMISGVKEAVSVASVFEGSLLISAQYQAYQIGILLMMGFLLFGVIFFGKRRSDEHKRDRE